MRRLRPRSDWTIARTARPDFERSKNSRKGFAIIRVKGLMKKKRHVPKFRRATPAARREALVEATLRCLKKYGHGGVSVRRISAAAGVSIGLINHHFPSKASLIAETYETLALSLLESIRNQAENKALSPRERLSNFFRASFA